MLERRIPAELNKIRLALADIDKYEPWRRALTLDLVDAIRPNCQQLLETFDKDGLPAAAWLARGFQVSRTAATHACGPFAATRPSQQSRRSLRREYLVVASGAGRFLPPTTERSTHCSPGCGKSGGASACSCAGTRRTDDARASSAGHLGLGSRRDADLPAAARSATALWSTGEVATTHGGVLRGAMLS